MIKELLAWIESIFGAAESEVRRTKHAAMRSMPKHQVDAYDANLLACLAELGANFKVQETANRNGLKHFFPVDRQNQVEGIQAYRVRHQGEQCQWVTFGFRGSFSSAPMETHFDVVRQAVIVELPFFAENAVIRRETLRDDVLELFGNVDVDFPEDPAFSRMFFVLGDNADQLQQALPRSFMEILKTEPRLVMRLHGKQAIVSIDGNITAADAVKLVELAFAIRGCE